MKAFEVPAVDYLLAGGAMKGWTMEPGERGLRAVVEPGSKIGQGTVRVLESAYEISDFKKGEVLVTDKTDPDWKPIMRIASAIVTDRGGRTCHAAIVSRELGIPCIIGTGNGTRIIKSGQRVTVDTSEGEGRVYDGILKFKIERTDLKELPKTRTKIMMNVGVPEQVFTQGQIPCDGVGLARLLIWIGGEMFSPSQVYFFGNSILSKSIVIIRFSTVFPLQWLSNASTA